MNALNCVNGLEALGQGFFLINPELEMPELIFNPPIWREYAASAKARCTRAKALGH